MSEKRKYTSPSSIHMKNWRKEISVGEKLDVRSRLEKVHVFFTYTVMFLRSHYYVKFVKILMELQKVLSQELNCLCSSTTTVIPESRVPKTLDVCLLYFYLIRNE